MARQLKKKKILEVQKFGGTEKVADVNLDHKYEVSTTEALSKTRLEDDPNMGDPVILRRFDFGINPEVWQKVKPTKQELFNYHLRGIELSLWRDGMKAFDGIEPRITINAEHMRYSIFVAAKVARGHILPMGVKPQSLTEIVRS